MLLRLLVAVLVLGGLLAGIVYARYGGGEANFPNRVPDVKVSVFELERVAELDLPPGNVAVARSGRIFFSFHPEARPPIQVAEWVDGQAVPYPDPSFQRDGSNPLRFRSVLSLRIDRQDRLWTLDNADHGIGQPRLLAFDLRTGEVVHHYDFPGEIAGLGSHLNDFQVDPIGLDIYIADASILAKKPALIVYDVQAKRARRMLEGHPSVRAESFVPVVQGRKMSVFGLFSIRPGIDSIALDRRGEWLYFAAVNSRKLYRIRTADLNDPDLSRDELAARVESYADKTMSDGISTDLAGNVYLTDLEHDAILAVSPERKIHLILRDPRLRWPDGLSFGPDRKIYVTCSALHHVIGKSRRHIRDHAPYHLFRFTAPVPGIPGH